MPQPLIEPSREKAGSPPRTEYYSDAFRSEISYVWGNTQFAPQITSMCLFRALATCVKRGQKHVAASRRLLSHYLSEYKAGKARDYINTMYKQLPVSTDIVRKYISNTCTLYKWAPTRTFGKNGSEDEIFQPVYEEYKVNRVLRRLHRVGRVVNTPAIRPIVRGQMLEFEILTPDNYRVELKGGSGRQVEAIWYPVSLPQPDGSCKLVLRRMTATKIEDRDKDDPKKIIASVDNEWGEIHFAFLHLEEDDDFYGGGENDLLELRMEGNGQRLAANTSVKYDGHSIMIATNILDEPDDEDEDEEVSLPPGAVISRQGVTQGEDMPVPPSVQFVGGSAQYGEIDDLRRKRQHEGLRNKGIPEYSLDENPGLPPSGAAMEVANRELDDVKEEDSEALVMVERDLKRKIALAINEAPVIVGEALVTGLPVNKILSVEYARDRVVLEPIDEWDLDKEKLDKDVISVVDFVEEHGRYGRRPSDEEAITYIRQNRKLRQRALVDNDDDLTMPASATPPVPQHDGTPTEEPEEE